MKFSIVGVVGERRSTINNTIHKLYGVLRNDAVAR